MTILPKKKLSVNKKIDFSEDSEVIEHQEQHNDDQVDDYEMIEDETLSALENSYNYIQQPNTIQEPSGTYYNNNSNETSAGNNGFPQNNGNNVFNQKKTQEKDYQEMLIVRQALDFDERAFRDSYIRTESEIILKMRKDIDALYDWLDRLVADLTKSLNTFQESKKTTIEEKLRAIRENSIRADAINRSIQNFLTSIQHAYQHTFAPFLDNE